MADGEESTLALAVAGAIDWWRDAGVDLCFDDEPARWISPAQPTALEAERLRTEMREAAPLSSQPRNDRSGDRPGRTAQFPSTLRDDAVDLSGCPDDFASFTHWWMTEPSLDNGRIAGRVAPRGPVGAKLMVLTIEPEADDGDRLLAGPQGRLLAALLAALGLGDDSTYVASALPRHMPMPDWSELRERGFGDVLARHIDLAAPERLIVFGDGVLSLLGNSLTNNSHDPRVFSQGERTVPIMPARSLEALIARPMWKAELWKGLLDWTPATLD